MMSVVQCALTLTAAVFLLDMIIRWQWLPLVFLGVMIGIAGWFFFLSIFAFLIRRNDTFNTALNLAYFVLMFVSSLFYPLDQVPEWLKVVSYANPLTWLTDALRFLTIGVGNPSWIILETLCFLVFLGISFWFAVRTLQKTV